MELLLTNAQTQLIRFIVDQLNNMSFNKSTTNRTNGVCALRTVLDSADFKNQ